MSMVNCDKHGYQHSIHVSRDLFESIRRGDSISAIRFSYTCEGLPADFFVLSLEVATANSLRDNETVELPDEYPAWVKDLVPVCQKCLAVSLGRAV